MLPSGEAEVHRVLENGPTLGEVLRNAGKDIQASQHFYGLEFIAADFLREAARADPNLGPQIRRIVDNLPTSALR